uniref:Putative beta-catenin-tcf/lef signaling pathway component drctnnb1a n=1 Tax=Tabanus bromius TaxID=304241 RepID=A0A0K8TRW8_TABBR
MAESIVTEWMAEYASLQSSEIHSFALMHENNQEVADALYTIFNERIKYPDLVHSVCNQFHSFYRSNEDTLKRFTLQFIPVLIYIYLNSVANGDKKSCRSVETLLISIYNVEVSTEDGQQKVVSFRMPVLAQASVYHEEKSLHPTDLRRWEENSNRDVKWGPLPQIELINAQNRMKVMTALLFSYNQQLSLIPKSALLHLCRIATQLVNQGFFKPGHAHRSSYGNDPNPAIVPKPLPRIALTSQFLLELIHAIYFAMFNEFGTIAIQTLEDIHNRACYEMFTDLILVTNAVRNSLHANPSGQPSDGPMGLSVALTPATNTVTVSKSMITNASFRTKKLPDDIPIQGAKDENQGGLMSITEEGGENAIGNRNSGVRSSKEANKTHKPLIAGFKKSKAEKDKDKDVKIIPLKNGTSIEQFSKETPPKVPPKRDKTANRNSLQLAVSSDSSEFDKSISLPAIKSKVVDHTSVVTTTEIVPLQNLTNGGLSDVDKGSDSFDTNCDASDSLDSSTEPGGTQRSSLTISDPRQIQMSQV